MDCILTESNIKLYKKFMPDNGMLSPRKKSLESCCYYPTVDQTGIPLCALEVNSRNTLHTPGLS